MAVSNLRNRFPNTLTCNTNPWRFTTANHFGAIILDFSIIPVWKMEPCVKLTHRALGMDGLVGFGFNNSVQLTKIAILPKNGCPVMIHDAALGADMEFTWNRLCKGKGGSCGNGTVGKGQIKGGTDIVGEVL